MNFTNRGEALHLADPDSRPLRRHAGRGDRRPRGGHTGDFDLDGLTDIAVVTVVDSLFVLYNSGGAVTDVPFELPGPAGPGIALAQSVPNPVTENATIRYVVGSRQHVRIALYDVRGRRVALLVDGEREAGPHEVVFTPGDLASGVYFYRLEAEGLAIVRKLLLVH